MKKELYTILLAILVSITGTCQKVVEETLQVAKGQEVSLEFKFADEIKITTWDKQEVHVKVTVNINDNENNDAFELETASSSEGVEIESKIKGLEDLHRTRTIKLDEDGEIISCSNSIDMDLYFEVTLPKDSYLDIETISGDLILIGLTGKLDIQTISGFIDIALPANHKANLKMGTISGSMYTNFDLPSKKENGYHHYHRRDMETKLNGGGEKVRLKTISGDIFLRKQ